MNLAPKYVGGWSASDSPPCTRVASRRIYAPGPIPGVAGPRPLDDPGDARAREAEAPERRLRGRHPHVDEAPRARGLAAERDDAAAHLRDDGPFRARQALKKEYVE